MSFRFVTTVNAEECPTNSFTPGVIELTPSSKKMNIFRFVTKEYSIAIMLPIGKQVLCMSVTIML